MSFTTGGIGTDGPWVRSAGNDSTTEFSLAHKIYDENDIVVLLTVDATNVTTLQTLTTDYTVSGVAEDAHDNTTPIITMLTPPATGETLTRYRKGRLIQNLSFVTGQFWQSISAELKFDLIVMDMQWMNLLLQRCATGSLADGAVTTTLEEILVAIGISPISSLPAKETPVDADVVRLGDSEDSDADKKLTMLNHFTNYIKAKATALYSFITSQAGAPGTTPSKVGDINVDLTGDVPYIATDTISSADWKRLVKFAELINSSAGGGDAGKPIALDAGGKVDATMINSADVTHNSTSGLNVGDYKHLTAVEKLAADGTVKNQIVAYLDGTSTGEKQIYLKAPCSGTITKMTIFGDVSGSAVVDIWKDTYANFPPTVADTIIGGGGTKPTLSTAQKNQDSTLTDWDKDFEENNIFEFNVDSSDLTKIIIILDYDKTGV